jgi:chromosome segregation ATPase
MIRSLRIELTIFPP